jgi:hypothetical protein
MIRPPLPPDPPPSPQLIAELQPADRRAWERKVLETIPRPPVVQYAPISMLPVRMCTVSHCHAVLPGHYPYRRCERHRLQNRHHSKLKRVRDKEVKSAPLRGESTEDAETAESGSRKDKATAIEPLYTSDPLDLDARELETEQAGVSEVCLPLFILFLPTIVVVSTTKHLTKAPSPLPLVVHVDQIRSVPSSGVTTYFTIVHHGRCVKPIERKIA